MALDGPELTGQFSELESNDTCGIWKDRSIGGATPNFLGGPNPSLHLVSLSDSFTFPSLPLSPPLPFPSLALEVGPLSTAKGLGTAVSSPSGVWGRAPVESEFGAF